MPRGKAGTLAPHGTGTRYNAGCRGEHGCTACREAHAALARANRRAHAYGIPISNLPAIGTTRRLQALAVIGWSFSTLDDMRGVARTATGFLARARTQTVTRAVAAQVSELYEQLSMTPGPSPITKSRALARGWLPPLAWDDIDDPNETPTLGSDRADDGDVDEIAVARVVAGDSLPLTTAERLIAIRLLAARGVSDIEIAQRAQVDPRTVGRDRWNNSIRPGFQPTQTHRPAHLRRTA